MFPWTEGQFLVWPGLRRGGAACSGLFLFSNWWSNFILQDTTKPEANVMLAGQILELPRSLTAKGGQWHSTKIVYFTLQVELACAGFLCSKVGGEREWQLLAFFSASGREHRKKCHDTDRHKSSRKSVLLTLQGVSVQVLAYRSESQR